MNDLARLMKQEYLSVFFLTEAQFCRKDQNFPFPHKQERLESS